MLAKTQLLEWWKHITEVLLHTTTCFVTHFLRLTGETGEKTVTLSVDWYKSDNEQA